MKCASPFCLGTKIEIGKYFDHSDTRFVSFIPVYALFKSLLAVYTIEHVLIPPVGRFSWLQTTAALVSSQESSHTVPHWLLRHTSTLPSLSLPPPTSRTPPVSHTDVSTEEESKKLT